VGAGLVAVLTGGPADDVDEAVRFLLTYGVSADVFPNTHETGFELLRSFRDGFLEGAKACNIGL
jgi:hypothetical protein